MSVGVKTFRGQRLTEARLARGLFKKALGDMIGVSGTAIARYEDGTDCPQTEKLELLARQLNFPVEFFTRPAWPEELEAVFWRTRSAETKSAREMTEQRMRWLCEIFALLEAEIDFPAVKIPDLDIPRDFRLITASVIERVTANLREEWGLRDQPIPDMILALENSGVPVTALELPADKQDGFCFISRRLDRAFAGINTENVSCVRARFDAAHELAHIVLHRNVTNEQKRDLSSHNILEGQAHRFASAILFPKASFIREVENVSLDYFSLLKKRWGISISAMIMRAYDLDMIDKEYKSALFRSMTKRRWRGPMREPFDLEMPLEKPRMLQRGIEVALRSGIFSKSSILSTLAMPPQEIEALTGVDAGLLSASGLAQPAVSPKHRDMAAIDMESGTVIEFPPRRRPFG